MRSQSFFRDHAGQACAPAAAVSAWPVLHCIQRIHCRAVMRLACSTIRSLCDLLEIPLHVEAMSLDINEQLR